MTLRNPFQAFVLMVACAMISACATLGLPTAETFNQKMVVAYGTVTQVRETATTLLQQKKITLEDAVNVQTAADVARVGLDTARKMRATDAAGADAKLSAIRTTLTALAAYLATKGQ